MTYSSVPWVHEYLQAFGWFESVVEFFAPDGTFQEFPNLYRALSKSASCRRSTSGLRPRLPDSEVANLSRPAHP
jgi:hypothetical protein